MAPALQLTGQDDGKVTTVSVDLNKWVSVLGFLFMVAVSVVGWIVGYGRNSSAADALKIEIAKDESKIEDQAAKMAKQSEDIRALQVEVAIYMSAVDSEKRAQKDAK